MHYRTVTSNNTKLVKRKHEPQSLARAMCVLAVYNKAQTQRISKREFKLWTFLQGTESSMATFHAQTCVMSHLQPWRLRVEHPSQITATMIILRLIVLLKFGVETPGCRLLGTAIQVNYLSSHNYGYFSIPLSFFKAILYKLYNPVVTVFKCEFVRLAGVMKRLLLKLFSLIVIKRLTSALKQTVIARYCFGTVNIFKLLY